VATAVTTEIQMAATKKVFLMAGLLEPTTVPFAMNQGFFKQAKLYIYTLTFDFLHG
jgi:hypothetical protein